MKRHINKVAVIGSGIMGSGIACHFANIGVEVLLLDIVPRELNDKEKAKGLTLEDKVVRNRLVNDSLSGFLKSKPSPIYHQKFADRITTGNLGRRHFQSGRCGLDHRSGRGTLGYQKTGVRKFGQTPYARNLDYFKHFWNTNSVYE